MIVAPREHQRARVGKAHDCIIRADLPDGVDGTLTADDLHVEMGVLVITFLDGDEKIRVAAIVTEVGDERDIVQRFRGLGDQQQSENRGYPASERTIREPCMCNLSALRST